MGARSASAVILSALRQPVESSQLQLQTKRVEALRTDKLKENQEIVQIR